MANGAVNIRHSSCAVATTHMLSKYVAAEALRAGFGLLVLPLLLSGLPNDQVVASIAIGGEWLRLNGTAMACFGVIPDSDSQCRYLVQAHCEAAACVWANPTAPTCTAREGHASSCDTSWGRCAGAGCAWERPLDLRARCRAQPAHASFGGPRCAALMNHEAHAIDAIRAEVRVLLTQLFAFCLGNLWMVRSFGSPDALMANGKHYVVVLFAAVASVGYVRLSLAST